MNDQPRRLAVFANCVWNFYQRCTPLLQKLAAEGVAIEYYEPMIYGDATEPHLVAETPIPAPPNMNIISRASLFPRGAIFAAYHNLWFAWLALRTRAQAAVLYPPQFCLLAAPILRLRRKRVVLDYIDDWPAWSKVPWEARAIECWCIPWVVWWSNACIVTAELLGKDIEKNAREIHWIPNGAAEAPPADADVDFGSGEGLVFVGGLAPRIDIQWLTGLAAMLPKTTLTVVGGGEQLAVLQEAAKALRNLRVTGPLPHGQAMAAMRAAAVGLIPYRPNRLTDRCFPIKLPEYRACGKPVVGTPCHELKRAGGDVVRTAATPADAAKICAQLLADREERARLGRLGIARARELHYGVLAPKFRDVCFPPKR